LIHLEKKVSRYQESSSLLATVVVETSAFDVVVNVEPNGLSATRRVAVENKNRADGLNQSFFCHGCTVVLKSTGNFQGSSLL
jgi:hypothetical protein